MDEFENWMNQIDNLCLENMSMTTSDIPDWHYMEAFEDGLSPKDAFDEMMEENFPDFV